MLYYCSQLSLLLALLHSFEGSDTIRNLKSGLNTCKEEGLIRSLNLDSDINAVILIDFVPLISSLLLMISSPEN